MAKFGGDGGEIGCQPRRYERREQDVIANNLGFQLAFLSGVAVSISVIVARSVRVDAYWP